MGCIELHVGVDFILCLNAPFSDLQIVDYSMIVSLLAKKLVYSQVDASSRAIAAVFDLFGPLAKTFQSIADYGKLGLDINFGPPSLPQRFNVFAGDYDRLSIIVLFGPITIGLFPFPTRNVLLEYTTFLWLGFRNIFGIIVDVVDIIILCVLFEFVRSDEVNWLGNVGINACVEIDVQRINALED